MTGLQKQKPICKELNKKLFTPQSVIGSSKVFRGSTNWYKINRQPIHINHSKRTMVFQMESNGKKYVGKFIRAEKQIQAITQIYFLKRFQGKNICNLTDVIKRNQGIWLIIEKGHCSLFDYLQKLKSSEVQIILKNIAQAYLPFFQQRIAHRDLKPGNIIIQENLYVKIIDLELCEKTDQMYGTPHYIPPHLKQIMWDSSDSYAYGMIAKQMTQKCGLIDQKLQQLIKNCISSDNLQKWTWREIYQFWNINPYQQKNDNLNETSSDENSK